MRFRIAQCLCGPARHALLAVATPDPSLTDEAIRESLKVTVKLALGQEVPTAEAVMPGVVSLVGDLHFDPWCALCGRRFETWEYEVRWSREFPDWDAALESLKANADANRQTHAFLDALGLTYNASLRRARTGTVQ